MSEDLQVLEYALRPRTADLPLQLSDEEAWARVAARIAKVPESGGRRFLSPRLVAGTGVLVAALIVGVVSLKHITAPAAQQGVTTYATENGQRARIILPDGSTAVLAPATTLRATGNGREIALQGEAVFTVNQQGSAPFVVKTGGRVIKVLGTTFGVRAYDSRIRVAVANGRVSVDDVTLSAGDVANAPANGDVQIVRNTDIAPLLSFASGQLSFVNQPLPEVIADLQRWYDVDIRVADAELLTRKVDGTFPGKSTAELVRTLEFILDVRVTRNGRLLTLHTR